LPLGDARHEWQDGSTPVALDRTAPGGNIRRIDAVTRRVALRASRRAPPASRIVRPPRFPDARRPLACLAALCALTACAGPTRAPVLTPAADATLLEAERAAGTLTRGALGVPPVAVRSVDNRLAPLSYALADLLTTDLARSRQLTLVERTRLGDVLRELELSASGRVDTATAPRVGRLVSARRLVLGGLDQLPAEGGLRIGVRLADVERGRIEQSIDAQAPLADILAAEKELVFRIFEALGVTLSPAERAEIEQRPTADIAALLAYGAGVQAEYLGDFRTAASEYRRAQRLDPRFLLAAMRAREARARAESGTSFPQLLPGLRARDAAIASTIDRINRPLDVVTGVTRNTGGPADPSFPSTAATILITITRP
jgi:TolB-like protein